MEDLDARRQRAAQNQSLFREVNERIASLSRRFAAELRPISYVCECFDTTCAATLELAPEEYAQIRARGTRFFVLPGHEDLAVENVVDETSRYLVVEKIGVAAEFAESMNPRKAAVAS